MIIIISSFHDFSIVQLAACTPNPIVSQSSNITIINGPIAYLHHFSLCSLQV